MKGLTPEEYKQLILSIGSHRASRPLTPIEVGLLLRKSISAGGTPKELASLVHLDGPSMIARFLRLLELPQEVHHLVDWGACQSTIAFTAASELARLHSQDEQQAAVSKALQSALSTSEIRQVVQARLRSNTTIDQCIEDVLKMRSQIERIHLFIGSVTTSSSREKLEALTQHERDLLLGQIMKHLYPGLQHCSSRLGPTRFTLTGGDSDALVLNSGAVDFESNINTALDRRLK